MKRLFLISAAIMVSALIPTITGCQGMTNFFTDEIPNFFRNELPEILPTSEQDPQDGQPLIVDIEGVGTVSLELTYPVGASPKVFTTGWIFGAKCLTGVGTPEEKDISHEVQWSGSGTFQPATGAISRPSFNSDGDNTITLSVVVGGQTISNSYKISAVSPNNYANTACWGECNNNSLGCPGDPSYVAGRIADGSSLVEVGELPAARVGDGGPHLPPYLSCGDNMFEISEGDPEVLIDGKPAARIGDHTQHDGGIGKVVREPSLKINAPPDEGEYHGWILASTTPEVVQYPDDPGGFPTNRSFQVGESGDYGMGMKYSASGVFMVKTLEGTHEASYVETGSWSRMPICIHPNESPTIALDCEAKLEIDPPLEGWGTVFHSLVIELDQRELGRCRVDANSDSPNPVKHLNVNIPALGEDLEGDTHRIQVRINTDSGWAIYTYIYEYRE